MLNMDALLAELRQKQATFAKAMSAEPTATESSSPASAEAPAAAASTEAPAAPAAPEAAAPAAAQAEAPAATADADAEDEDALDNEGEDFGKSLDVFDADGNPVPGVDGWAVIKALRSDIAALNEEVVALREAAKPIEGVAKSFVEAEGYNVATEAMMKSIGEAFDALTATREQNAAMQAQIAAQADLIKSLSGQVAAFGNQGRGRESTVSVQDRPSALPKPSQGPTIGDIFAKAQELNAAGKMTSIDVARVVSRTNSGQAIPDDLRHLFAA